MFCFCFADYQLFEKNARHFTGDLGLLFRYFAPDANAASAFS